MAEKPLLNMTIRVRREVADGLGRMALRTGQETADYVASVLGEHAADELGDAALAARIRAEAALKRRAAELARGFSPLGGFDPDVTLKVFRAIRADGDLLATYREAVGADTGTKVRINRTLGAICKVTSGGISRGPSGEVVTIQVSGELCRTYTRLFPPGSPT